MKQLYVQTALIEIPAFNIPRKTLRFKMEASQPCGSFKLRGVECACRDALNHGAAKFLSSSGGNAGLAVAYVGNQLQVPVTVVLPKTTANETAEKLRGLNAEVIIHGDAWDEAHLYCLDYCKTDASIAYSPPFEHPKLWEGHATIVDELVEQCEREPDLIIASVGGGGLMCGIMEGLKRNHWEHTHVLAVETIGADSLNCAFDAGHLVTLDRIYSVAKSLGAKCVSPTALAYAQTSRVTPFRVEDARAVAACIRFANEARVIVEPACGAPLAPVLDQRDVLKPYQNIGAGVCGGSNVNLDILNQWKADFSL